MIHGNLRTEILLARNSPIYLRKKGRGRKKDQRCSLSRSQEINTLGAESEKKMYYSGKEREAKKGKEVGCMLEKYEAGLRLWVPRQVILLGKWSIRTHDG